ncbi:coenzyme F420-0:L-glutamate ligase [Lutispora thermophila]|uniref:F420-0:Gamma-glutamyl ligase n=1 Tax=Lutispora thermophila DSM 19022 TaxID=1122184 RepID=A0A1M6I8R1_9FIRM|nr:coenzyme F420-0:L-glutamate ligase [Lutispora thermophila]SHJ30870.1 F420-0:Gamma-glutamyl ligase [Lutispora thermophila DSM 19022]
MSEDKKKKEKQPIIEYNNKKYLRIPVKTHVIVKDDNIVDVVKKYTQEILTEDDIVFISEKAVAITQGRAYPLEEIKPRPLAKFLSRFVTKTPAGIGLGIPETMEMALRECGVIRILFAAAVSFFGKLIGRRGDFYRIAGYKASSIDGPTPNTLPPYNRYVVLGPENPDKVAKEISQSIKAQVAIVDINDLGGNILGTSEETMDRKSLLGILRDNPLGQCSEQTPIGIIRRIEA